eukprot:275491-Pelagomonas_calceolata.AAC.1
MSVCPVELADNDYVSSPSSVSPRLQGKIHHAQDKVGQVPNVSGHCITYGCRSRQPSYVGGGGQQGAGISSVLPDPPMSAAGGTSTVGGRQVLLYQQVLYVNS